MRGRARKAYEMNPTIRRILTANSASRKLYCAARQAYHARRVARRARLCFLNHDEFKKALFSHGATATVWGLVWASRARGRQGTSVQVRTARSTPLRGFAFTAKAKCQELHSVEVFDPGMAV